MTPAFEISLFSIFVLITAGIFMPVLTPTIAGIAAGRMIPGSSAFNHDTAWNFGVDHPVLRDLMLEAQGTVDNTARYAIMAEAARFMYDNALSVGLYAQNQVFALSGDTEPWPEHLNYAETRDLTALEYAPNLTQ